MASTLIKSDLSVIDRIWVDDPPPDNVPGDFYGNGGGGGGGGTGATLPTGTPTNDFVGGDLSSGGSASSPGGFSPQNQADNENNNGGDSDITYTDENGETVREITSTEETNNDDGTTTTTTLVVTLTGTQNSDGSYSGYQPITMSSRTNTE